MRAARTWHLLAVLVGWHVIGARAAFAERVVLDDFADLAGWTAIASEGTHVWIARESDETGTGMRIGFDRCAIIAPG